jgi:deoxyribodipyrimidine photo-lyase
LNQVPEIRIRRLNDAPINGEGDFVLYWMTATRRLEWNYALDHAVNAARTLSKPLVILEALSVDYRWANERHHQAILDGMLEHERTLVASAAHYYPYVESEPGAGAGLITTLAESACWVITDDSPVFFTPHLLEAASRIGNAQVEAVDSCGLLPLGATDRGFSAAYHFRRFLHKELIQHLASPPAADSLLGAPLVSCAALDHSITTRWPRASEAMLSSEDTVRHLPIDHSITRTEWTGGATPARARLRDWIEVGLPRYADDRNHPDLDASSTLSPWLHYGHISPHEVFAAVTGAEGWTPLRLSRELGIGYCRNVPDYATYETLPQWARSTLEDHVSDPREHTYSLEQFESAATHDELWNAAQRQLTDEGIIHNYLRMLWGKKILEWTRNPREAFDIMVELNNRYALDGRDPNSYSGIAWVMGRFDRGWPERPVFGKVRSMSSPRTRKKVSLEAYLTRLQGVQKTET